MADDYGVVPSYEGPCPFLEEGPTVDAPACKHAEVAAAAFAVEAVVVADRHTDAWASAAEGASVVGEASAAEGAFAVVGASAGEPIGTWAVVAWAAESFAGVAWAGPSAGWAVGSGGDRGMV